MDSIHLLEHVDYTFGKSKFEAADLKYEYQYPYSLILRDSCHRRVLDQKNLRLKSNILPVNFEFDDNILKLISMYIDVDIPRQIKFGEPGFLIWISQLYLHHLQSVQLQKKQDTAWKLKTLQILGIHSTRPQRTWCGYVSVVPTRLMLNNSEIVTGEKLQTDFQKGPGFWNRLFPNLSLTLSFSHLFSFDRSEHTSIIEFQ